MFFAANNLYAADTRFVIAVSSKGDHFLFWSSIAARQVFSVQPLLYAVETLLAIASTFFGYAPGSAEQLHPEWILMAYKNAFMTIGGNAFNLHSKLKKIIEIFFDFFIMLAIWKANQLCISIIIILIADHTELPEVGGIYT